MHIPRTEYGKAINGRLSELDMKKETLIELVHEKTGKFFDYSYLGKIMVGTQSNPIMIAAINEILQLEGKQNE